MTRPSSKFAGNYIISATKILGANEGTGLLKLNVRQSDGAGARLGTLNNDFIFEVLLKYFLNFQ